jgi:hypothetical protein
MQMRAGSRNVRRLSQAARLGCALLLAFAADAAHAEDLLGFYAGGAFGKAWLDASDGLVSNFGSDKHASEFIVGWRPISELAAELEYINFGSSSGFSTYPNSNIPLLNEASRKGLAAYGVLYLPTPVVDFYLKAGVAKLHTKTSTIVEPCPMGGTCPPLSNPIPVNSTGVGLTGGGGVMYRFRRIEARFDYARFATNGGGNPYLMTLGLTWTF